MLQQQATPILCFHSERFDTHNSFLLLLVRHLLLLAWHLFLVAWHLLLLKRSAQVLQAPIGWAGSAPEPLTLFGGAQWAVVGQPCRNLGGKEVQLPGDSWVRCLSVLGCVWTWKAPIGQIWMWRCQRARAFLAAGSGTVAIRRSLRL